MGSGEDDGTQESKGVIKVSESFEFPDDLFSSTYPCFVPTFMELL